MDNHKLLFKAQSSVLSPHNQRNTHRDRQRQERSKKRGDYFQSNRQISVSPSPTRVNQTPHKSPLPVTTAIDAQENEQPLQSATKQTISKSTRQEQYLQRFLKWKAASKQQALLKKERRNQPAPEVFVPPKRRSLYVTVDAKTMTTVSNAKIIHKTAAVKPNRPADIVDAAAKPKTAANCAVNNKPAAAVVAKIIHKTDAVKPNTATNSNRPADNIENAKLNAATNSNRPADIVDAAPKPKTAANCAVNNKPAAAVVAKIIHKTAAVKPNTATNSNRPADNIENAKLNAATNSNRPADIVDAAPKPKTAINSAIKHNTAANCAVKTKPAAAVVAVKTKPAVVAVKTTPAALAVKAKPALTAAVEKFTASDVPAGAVKTIPAAAFALKPKPAAAVAEKTKAAAAAIVKPKSRPRLSMRMKPKKSVPNNKQKRIEQKLLNIILDEPTPDTPLELLNNDIRFDLQITSTQYKSSKSSANLLLEEYGDISLISPLSAIAKPVANGMKLSAKRKLLSAAGTPDKQPKPKFNFVRYSEINSVNLSPNEAQALQPNTTGGNDAEDVTLQPQTPPQNAEYKSNYLSPFVSVSRGKVNSRTEREKRNSMYLQDEGQAKPETPVAVRRTLETVQYFRMVLEMEINRLNGLCDKWEDYCNQNVVQLETTGGKDMLDAAIGQTRLLTSKKLMQFKSLIDRCEAGATGIGLHPNDGSEATKPVLAEDLEGWWDMMRLQSDNVDKRFDNIERWRANEWLDPDMEAMAKPASKPKPKTKSKPKPCASSNVRSFLRKAFAEKKKNQFAEDISQANGTPKRRSRVIMVRDRKSFSPSPTILRMATGSGNRPSMSNALLKSAIKGAKEEKSRQQTTPPTSTRMSILKTPGTKKRETALRGVVFSAKKNVRRFQFSYDEGISGDEDEALGVVKLEDCEEDMSVEKRSSQASDETIADNGLNVSRTYTLRNRRVKLRPSSDFM